MKLKNLKVAEENFSSTPYSLERKKIVVGTIVGLALAMSLGISQNSKVTQEQTSLDNKQVEYYESHKEEYPTLRVVLENPSAIQTEDMRILINNQDNLLLEYIKAYPDGYIDIKETYLFPGDECEVKVNFNNKRQKTNFTVGSSEDSKTEYQLIIDCETGEMRVERETKEIENIPHL